MKFQNKEVAFSICDSKYFMDYGFAFIASSLFYENSTHIHLINPTEEIKHIASSLSNKNPLFTFSYNEVDFSTMSDREIGGYFVCIRFLLIPKLFEIDNAIKVTMMDIDSIIRKPLFAPKEAVGIFLRDYNKEIHFKVAGGILYINSHGVNFLNEFNSLLSHYMNDNKMQWYIDQIALYQMYQKVKNKKDIHIFTEEYFSWSNHKDACIWTAKGNRKFTDTLFLKEKKHFEDMFKTLTNRLLAKPIKLDI